VTREKRRNRDDFIVTTMSLGRRAGIIAAITNRDNLLMRYTIVVSAWYAT